MRARSTGGYTLIEVLVTIVILSILAGIAIPAYTAQVRKSRRTDARTAVLDIAGREERLFSTTNSYSTTPSDIGYGAAAATFPMPVGDGGYYSVSVTTAAGPPATFTVTATPVSGKGQDKDAQCASFAVDQTGKQTALDSGGSDATSACWR
jgi:type IV pilus assembly protein PilE